MFYPVNLDIKDRHCLVVGGGPVAARKAKTLMECEAMVTVVSPEFNESFRILAQNPRLTLVQRPYEISDLEGKFLVIGATSDEALNRQINADAESRNMLCNIADVPDLCTFIVPAVITQGDLMIAVSTGGSSPALARRIREDLEQRFGPEYAEMTKLMGEIRRLVLAIGMPSDENKKLFTEIVDSTLLDALKKNDKERALEILRSILPREVDPQSAVAETSNA